MTRCAPKGAEEEKVKGSRRGRAGVMGAVNVLLVDLPSTVSNML
jgi:hypothetical protein